MTSEPLTLVLAEDDDGHANLIQRNLRRSGVAYPIVHLKDGQAALDYARRQGDYANRSPQGALVFLLDINMPRLDGVEVLRQLKKAAETNHLPVLMLSTTDDPREVQRCYDLGCNVYLTKPVAYSEFVEMVSRLGMLLAMAEFPKEN